MHSDDQEASNQALPGKTVVPDRRVLLFDLGGVLVDLGRPVELMRLDADEGEFWGHWVNSAAVRAYEAGRIGIDQLSQSIAVDIPAFTGLDFRERFADWRLSVFAGAIPLLGELRSRWRTALLSNTNPGHWQPLEASSGIAGCFDAHFLSYETGHLKPDAPAFEQVLDHFDVPAEEVYFFDDTEVNVAAARRLGMQATRVAGINELRSAIAAIA